MKVRVRLFAMLRERAGWRERELELPAGSSIDDLWHRLVGEIPGIEATRSSVRFALNRRYASADETLSDGDELALIPPVAGGAAASNDRSPAGRRAAGGLRTAAAAGQLRRESNTHEGQPRKEGTLLRCEIREKTIEDELLAELRATVPTDADGALVLFVGQTRESAGTPAPGEEEEAARYAGQRVTGLDYEAFEEMALDVLHSIGREIADRFDVHRLAIIHRVGRVSVGEPSVVIAAAAAHRGAAFDAARYAIEELKARAPIWKQEHFADGSVWIGTPAREGPHVVREEG
jgi:molybdopterin converting factor subunit 1